MADPRRLAIASIVTGALLAGSASASAEAGTATVLRARLNSDIASTNPGVLRDENTDAVLLHVVEGLVAYREDASIGPLLAERWRVTNGGRNYVFALRSGVRFHNGAVLGSADVVWSFRRYLDPATHWRCRREFTGGGYARIVGVSAEGPLNVRIRLDRPSPDFLKTLARVDCGETAILQRASVDAKGAWRRPIGTGPFRFAGWQRNQYVDLVRFGGYRPLPGLRDGNTGGKHALVDRVRFLVIPDAVAAQAALLRGDLDVLDGIAPIDARQLRSARGVTLISASGTDVVALLFQTRDPLLADPRMRRAIALTLDMTGLVRTLTEGTSRPNRSVVPVASAYHGPVEQAVPPRDLAGARRLARAAGYRGQPITLVTNHRYPYLFDAAVLIQAMAMEAGIDIRLQTLDWAAELERYGAGRYQAMMFAYSSRLDPALGYDSMIGDKGTDPRKVWDDPRARALLEQARGTVDGPQRQALFDCLHEEMLRQVPAVVLYDLTHIAAIRSGVTGYRPWPAAQMRLWGVAAR